MHEIKLAGSHRRRSFLSAAFEEQGSSRPTHVPYVNIQTRRSREQRLDE
jgi:hypothetical protein